MTISDYLKDQRIKQHFSLKEVYKATGIPDSKLSKIERGAVHLITAKDLQKLSHLFCLDPIKLFLLAGFLNGEDIKNYQYFFDNVDLLTSEESATIQELINHITKGRETKSNDI